MKTEFQTLWWYVTLHGYKGKVGVFNQFNIDKATWNQYHLPNVRHAIHSRGSGSVLFRSNGWRASSEARGCIYTIYSQPKSVTITIVFVLVWFWGSFICFVFASRIAKMFLRLKYD